MAVDFRVDFSTSGAQKAVSEARKVRKATLDVATATELMNKAGVSGGKKVRQDFTKRARAINSFRTQVEKFNADAKRQGVALGQVSAGLGRFERSMRKANLSQEQFAASQDRMRRVLSRGRTRLRDVSTTMQATNATMQKGAAKTDAFRQSMVNATKSVQLALGPLSGVAARITAFSAIVTQANLTLAGFIGSLIGIGGLVFAAKKAAAEVDKMRKVAERTGVTFENFQELAFAASQQGVKNLEKSLETFSRRLGDARQGVGEATQAFEQLGISLRDIQDLGTGDALRLVADRFQGLEGSAEGAAIAADLFSRANIDMVKLLNLGSQGLDEFATQARILGLVLDNELAAQATATTDRLDQLGKVIKFSLIRFVQPLIPLLENLAAVLIRIAPHAERIVKFLQVLAGATFGLFIGKGLGKGVEKGLNALLGKESRVAKFLGKRGGLLGAILGGGIAAGLSNLDAIAKILEKLGFKELAETMRAMRTVAENVGSSFGKVNNQLIRMNNEVDVSIAKQQKLIEALRGGGSTGTVETNQAIVESLNSANPNATPLTLNSLNGRTVSAQEKALVLGVKRNKQLERTRQIVEDTLSPQQRFNSQMEELEQLKPFLTVREFEQAMADAKGTLLSTSPLFVAMRDGVKDLGQEMFISFQKGENALESLADTARNVVNRIANAFFELAVLNPILQNLGLAGPNTPTIGSFIGKVGSALFGGVSAFGGGGGGTISNFSGGGSIPAPPMPPAGRFQHGGRFTVGGSGGTDSQRVSFLATPGEDVSITNKRQQRTKKEGGDSYFIDARGADAAQIRRLEQTIRALHGSVDARGAHAAAEFRRRDPKKFKAGASS